MRRGANSNDIRSIIPAIVLTVFLSIISLELTLRLGGWLFLSKQDFDNQRSFGNKHDITILTLGESTTASGGDSAWPRQLERILNNRNTGKRFSVVNKAVNSTNSWLIVDGIDANLNAYKPDIVIAMMGVNDDYGSSMYAKEFIPKQNPGSSRLPDWITDLRLYKVWLYMRNILLRYFTPKAAVASESNAAGQNILSEKELTEKLSTDPANDVFHYQLGVIYFLTERMDASESELNKALSLNSRNKEATLYLGRIYERTNRDSEAEALYIESVRRFPDNPTGYIALGDLYSHYFESGDFPLTDYGKAEAMYKKATEVDPKSEYAWRSLAKFYRQKEAYGEALEAYGKLLTIKPDVFVYLSMGDTYTRLGNTDEARKYYEKAREVKPTLSTNYQVLKEKILATGARFAAVQYPLRNIEPLLMLLGYQPGVGNVERQVLIIDNEKVFSDALKQVKYEDLFYDRFAGDFGHATPKGNELLATHVADEIISAFFAK